MKYLILFLILLVSTHSVFAQASFEDFNKGKEFYKSFDLRNAAIEFEKAFKTSPNNYYVLQSVARVFNDLGEDYYEIRDEKNAEISVNKAVKYAELFAKQFPDSAKVYALLAMSYGNLAMYRGGNEKIKLAYKIKENAEKSIRMNPNDYLPYIILSVYHRQIASLNWFERAFANTFFGQVPDGSLEESEKMMLRALSIQPNVVIAMFHLSLTYKEMDNEKKEIEWLKKVINAPINDFRDKYAKRKARERLKELS